MWMENVIYIPKMEVRAKMPDNVWRNLYAKLDRMVEKYAQQPKNN